MLFSAWIMFSFWDFYLPATLTISACLSWLVSPEAEEPIPSLRAWERKPEVVVARTIPVAEARLPQVGLSHHVLQTRQAVKPLRGLKAHCRGWEGPLVTCSVMARVCSSSSTRQQLCLEDHLQRDPALSGVWKGTVPSRKSHRDVATMPVSSLCFSRPEPPSLGHCSFIFLESTVYIFQPSPCTSAAAAQ